MVKLVCIYAFDAVHYAFEDQEENLYAGFDTITSTYKNRNHKIVNRGKSWYFHDLAYKNMLEWSE